MKADHIIPVVLMSAGLLSAGNIQAHEARCLASTTHHDPCYYLVLVGFTHEPALANEVNGLDLWIKKNVGTPTTLDLTKTIPDFDDDTNNGGAKYVPVDVMKDDTIMNVMIHVLRLKKQTHITTESDKNVISATMLKPYYGYTMMGPLVQSMDPIFNYKYSARFITGPTGPRTGESADVQGVGAYGFHIMAMINDETYDEFFVCGQGTTNPTGDAFSCVGAPQKIK
ncbi:MULTISPECIES: hypothetical protein [Methylococcus]|uniref:Lipoprotein n=1 Tax=Methylococcus capsulatus TaxID=414 RepID=A0ABZ2F792_METCP|nr:MULTISPECIES: hypothetical protein [Methylococcus]MDF9392291.1 hypothetical protein [Methylococcus capsulatus]